jgi:hypothetical protein
MATAIDAHTGKLFIVDAHRDDGKRYIVHSDEKLTAFLEAEKVTRNASNDLHDQTTAKACRL